MTGSFLASSPFFSRGAGVALVFGEGFGVAFATSFLGVALGVGFGVVFGEVFGTGVALGLGGGVATGVGVGVATGSWMSLLTDVGVGNWSRFSLLDRMSSVSAGGVASADFSVRVAN